LIPVAGETRGVCELLGMDPLYIANEGKMVVILPGNKADQGLEILRSHKYGASAAMIGEVVETPPGRVFMRTVAGGSRILDMLSGDQLPRIC